MKNYKKIKISQILALILFFFCPIILAKPISIVAAENIYGEIAQQIGGPNVKVTSILKNPNQDPHLFSTDPSTARAIKNADIIIYNGIDYDPWMPRLLATSEHKPNTVMIVAQIVGKHTGDNPHLWYDPATMPLFVAELAKFLAKNDLTNQAYYYQQQMAFNQSYQPLLEQITDLKHRYQNQNIIATEPVFNYMAEAIGLKVLAPEFQLSIMNDIPPSPSQIKEFQDYLQTKTAKVLIYNNQVSNPVTERMRNLAVKYHVPTIGVSEIQPAGKTYVQWMQQQLSELNKALEK